MTTRRVLLRAAAAGAAGAAGLAGAGCGADRRVQVAVIWSGDELRQFRDAVAGYDRPVDVVSARDAIDSFIRARLRAAPDVAVVSRPGLVREYAANGWLSPLDDVVAGRYPEVWTDLLRREAGGPVYGAWVKAAHKSLFWHFRSELAAGPGSWSQFVTLVADLAADGGTPPLAIGAADGWVLTDWFENMLAATMSTEEYHALALRGEGWTGPAVRDALAELARVWRIERVFPGGPERALLTQFEESVIQVVRREAVMVFEADFVAGTAARFIPDDEERLETFRFPARGGAPPLVVGGDAAVVFRSTAGLDLVDWLTRPDRFRGWAEATGYLSPHLNAPEEYRDDRVQEFAEQLRAAADDVRFDLSDLLPGAFTGADGVGIWRILQDFFAEVAVSRTAPGEAARRTAEDLAAAHRATLAGAGGWL